MDWPELKLQKNLLYGGTFVKKVEYENKAEWTSKTGRIRSGKSIRYMIVLKEENRQPVPPQKCFIYGCKALNQAWRGIEPGADIAFTYEGTADLKALDTRGIPYKKILMRAVYRNPEEEYSEEGELTCKTQ